MDALRSYIHRINTLARLFGDEQISVLTLDQPTVDRIVNRLNSDLSPEHLHEDGEITAREARQKREYLENVYDQLCFACSLKGLDRPQIMEMY